MGAENWELIMGTSCCAGDACACALMARVCSRILLEIEELIMDFNVCFHVVVNVGIIEIWCLD